MRKLFVLTLCLFFVTGSTLATCEFPPCEINVPRYNQILDVEPDWCLYTPGDVVMLLIDGSPFVPERATSWFVVRSSDPDAGYYQGLYSNLGWQTNYYVQVGCYIDAGPW